ncbi:ABC transporter permease [Corynebacterium pseudodiphtheriticum]|uniref:ABC transporter permease n=1 Tax=Corynebacterium pseudodiphtheriticum TaxID=37637 RepID=A0ABT7FYP2_9CORY|nr:ABC transporter permease [Corynebacterium pseudodiphtheriticum]MDK4291122.1 ABC transporter permease [Corynebacterium pseudodiphtheriticum]
MNVVRSEIAKLTSLRSTWVYAILLVGSIAGPVVLMGLFASDATTDFYWNDLLIAGGLFQMLAIIYAAASTSRDLAHGMHGQAFLTQPQRWNWLAAKMLVTGVFVLVLLAVSIGISLVVAPVFGLHLDSSEATSILWAVLIGYPLYAVAAVGLAALVRSQIAAVGLPIVWMLIVEQLLASAAMIYEFLRPVAQLLPNTTFESLTTGFAFYDYIHTGWAGAAVLVGWLVVLCGLGFLANQKRDVK